MVRTTIWILFCVLSSLPLAHAQVGINVHYETWSGDVFGDHFQVSGIANASAPMLGIDYWFRLKQKRVEFLPTLYFVDFGDDFKTKQIGMQFRGTIYPFDLEGDCNCPTFSKEKGVIQKGFFIRLAPGFSFTSANSEIAGLDVSETTNMVLPEIGTAIGIDFGVSNLLTISPELRYRYVFGGKWENDFNDSFSGTGSLAPGLRLGLRFDEKNYGFKPRRRKYRRR